MKKKKRRNKQTKRKTSLTTKASEKGSNRIQDVSTLTLNNLDVKEVYSKLSHGLLLYIKTYKRFALRASPEGEDVEVPYVRYRFR